MPYLKQLGVSHLYCSPILTAEPGSTHGYDVVDPTHVNPELGGEDGFEHLQAAVSQAGIGLVLDIVPNHMSIASNRNCWWWDVLANGRQSRFASWFDIDWDAGGGKVIVPILGRELDDVIAANELLIETADQRAVLRYYEHTLPVSGDSQDRSLHEVLDAQHYRLEYWRHGLENINYRRFFDVSTLAGIRVEDSQVFESTHRLVFDAVHYGRVAGVRVDHPDGLADPRQYFERLREQAPEAWIVAEKVLEPGERLPPDWPVDGTTGYDFMNCVLGLFIDSESEQQLTETYECFTGEGASWEEIARQKRELVMRTSLQSEVARLARAFPRRDSFADAKVRDALIALIACFGVYRTYTSAAGASAIDQKQIETAVNAAKRLFPDLNGDAVDAIGDALLDRTHLSFATRFQQTTSPVMAKGVEDTAFYCFNRFIGLNDVGGNPGRFGTPVTAFHERNCETAATWPVTMLTTSTHDTKRSEDVRARLALLSEIPGEWSAAVNRWRDLNQQHWRATEPDRNLEYFLYQTLVGAYPLTTERALDYTQKAVREAKRRTSWLDQNEAYERAVAQFVEACLSSAAFTEDVERFVGPLIRPGRINALAQKLLALTSPGVPDVYQGTELWNLFLVDPDNRRVVDYETRIRLLDHVEPASAAEAWQRDDDEGCAKLLLVKRTLDARNRFRAAFEGDYRPIHAHAERASHVAAFARGDDIVVVAPRLVMTLNGNWGRTSLQLPDGAWFNEFTREPVGQGSIEMSELLSDFPVALLTRNSG